jgi:type I restriction enzyme S subunit
MTQLPTGWLYESINSIVVGGMIADGDWVESKDQDSNGQVRLTQLADVGDGEFRSRSDRWMNDEQASRLNVNYLRPGDLLMARMPDPLGRTCMVPENIGRAVTVVDVAIIRIARKDVNPKFVMWLLNSPGIRQQIEMLASGTTRRRITRKNLGTIDLPMPPIDEQHKIVELLEDHLSRLDAALADVKQAKLKAFQFRRSLLQAAFNGYLSDELFTIGSEIPPSWRKISLGNVLEPRKQKDIPSSYPNLPYIGMEHVARDVGLIHSFGSSANYRSAAPRVYEGDVLYGRLRPYLNKVAISPCEAFASGEFIVLSPNEKISGKFLQLRLLSQDFVEFAGTLDTGDRPRVSWEQISRFELALPPIDEQMKMMSSLEDHLSRLDASVSLADAMEKQSNGLRRSLLQAAFTGQLTNEVVSV